VTFERTENTGVQVSERRVLDYALTHDTIGLVGGSRAVDDVTSANALRVVSSSQVRVARSVNFDNRQLAVSVGVLGSSKQNGRSDSGTSSELTNRDSANHRRTVDYDTNGPTRSARSLVD
jgi:hypothetical protein